MDSYNAVEGEEYGIRVYGATVILISYFFFSQLDLRFRFRAFFPPSSASRSSWIT